MSRRLYSLRLRPTEVEHLLWSIEAEIQSGRYSGVRKHYEKCQLDLKSKLVMLLKQIESGERAAAREEGE